MLVEMLNILENFDLAAMGHNSADYIRVVAEAMKMRDRPTRTPMSATRPSSTCRWRCLTDKAYAREHAERIRRGETDPCRAPGRAEIAGTTHDRWSTDEPATSSP